MSHTRLAINPTVINLKDLPAEGRKFTYTQESAELTPTLTDLIGKKPYRIEIELKPMGNVFKASGTISAGMDLLCSLCAIEFEFPIKQSFEEILIIQEELDRVSQQARVNHSSELNMDGPSCTELTSDSFDIGEFIHELVALAEPMKPTGKPNCDPTCENFQAAVATGWLTPQNDVDFSGNPAFSVLKKLKLNS